MNHLINVRNKTVIPALLAIDSYSLAAEQLVMATGMAESGFIHTRQIAKYQNGKPVYGPARGWFQMEPFTHNDLFQNYIGATSKSHLLDGLRKISDNPGDPEELVNNQQYAAAMCRIHYLRVKESLPKENYWQNMAKYWKKYYNTPLGKGTESGFLEKAQPVVDLYGQCI